MHDPTISIEGNRFLLPAFQPRGRWEPSCSQPPFLTRPSTSLVPQKATSQNHVQKFPLSLSVLKSARQADLHRLWNVHLWVSESPSSCSSSLLQDLGYAVLSLHVMVQENMCCATLNLFWQLSEGKSVVQGGTRPKRVSSPYIPKRSKSSFSLTLNLIAFSLTPHLFSSW